MSGQFTRNLYDPCEKQNSCGMNTSIYNRNVETGLYAYENKNVCAQNNNSSVNYFFSDTPKRVDIENNLFGLNLDHQNSNCNLKNPSLCLNQNNKSPECNETYAVRDICDRYNLCPNLQPSADNYCFGLNGNLSCGNINNQAPLNSNYRNNNVVVNDNSNKSDKK